MIAVYTLVIVNDVGFGTIGGGEKYKWVVFLNG